VIGLLRRARAKLNAPEMKRRARLAEMQLTPEEVAWWRVERRRHVRNHWLRTGLPWAAATSLGSLLRPGIPHHPHAWLIGVISGVVVGSLMAYTTWRPLETIAQTRELCGRRLRHDIAAGSDLAEPAHR